jgi:hypothetical protein
VALLSSRRGSHEKTSTSGGGLAAPDEPTMPDGSSCGGGACSGAPGERWAVLLDAAKACGSGPPNLTAAPADFVVCACMRLFWLPFWCARACACFWQPPSNPSL